MSDTENAFEVLPLNPTKGNLEKVVKLNGLVWGQDLDANQIQRLTERLGQFVEELDSREICFFVAVLAGEIVGSAQPALRQDFDPGLFLTTLVLPDFPVFGFQRRQKAPFFTETGERGLSLYTMEQRESHSPLCTSHRAHRSLSVLS